MADLWTSDDPAIATVGELGLARARAPGQTAIRAAGRYEGVDFEDAATFTVTAPEVTVEEFRIVPPSQATYDGALAQFDAELLLSMKLLDAKLRIPSVGERAAGKERR